MIAGMMGELGDFIGSVGGRGQIGREPSAEHAQPYCERFGAID
jgi:hypothetical protein